MPNWIAVVIIIILAFLFAAGTMAGTMILKPRRPSQAKAAAYESGVRARGDTRGRHSVRFYMVAMLFLVFDVELAFLYPWALAYNAVDEKLFLFVEMVVFIGILLVAYFYAWRKGALDWNR